MSSGNTESSNPTVKVTLDITLKGIEKGNEFMQICLITVYLF